MRPLNIIVCVDIRFGFAKDSKIPWRFSEDLKRFQQITKNHYCIMGRHTYEEIYEKRKEKISAGELLLPNRESFVLSRDPEFVVNGATKEDGLRKTIDFHCTDETKSIFILGGEKLFIEALPFTNTVYMTFIEKDFKCDQFFNLKYTDTNFSIKSGEKWERQKGGSEKFKKAYFLTLQRVK